MTQSGSGRIGQSLFDPDGLTGDGAERLRMATTRIVVIGAGGWLGLATLELLRRLLGEGAFNDRVLCFGSQARTLRLRGGGEVAQQPLSTLASLPCVPSLVLHLAYLTQEKARAMTDDAYMAANRAISGQVLDALDIIGAVAVFLPSSGAVYAVDSPWAAASMRLYGRLKLEDEARFAEWAQARDARAVIVRVFNLAGPYINKQSSYALSSFIADALAGRDIEIKATKPVVRSYVAISEMMSLVFAVLTDGDAGVESFDTAGDVTQEMAEIAVRVQSLVAPNLRVRRPPLEAIPEDRYVGDGETYRALRAKYHVAPVDFSQQVLETARYMADEA